MADKRQATPKQKKETPTRPTRGGSTARNVEKTKADPRTADDRDGNRGNQR